MKKLFALLLTLTLMLSCCIALGETAQEPITLRIGILDGWTGFVTKYIIDNQLDIDAGVDLEYLVFSSGAPANEAMTAGELDCAILGGGATVPALANLNSKLILECNNDSIGLSLIGRNGLACNSLPNAVTGFPGLVGNAESVKGLTILTTSGTLQYYATLKYLEAIGLTQDDVKLVSMDANQAYQAFELGEGDILTCSNNYSFKLVKAGNTELASLTTLNCSATAQLIASDAAFNNPEKVEALTRFVKVLASTHDIMNADTALATKCYIDWVSLNGGTPDEESCRAIMECKPYYGVEDCKNRELGADFLNNFVSFYIMTEQIEEEQRETIAANVRTDIIKAAGLH